MRCPADRSSGPPWHGLSSPSPSCCWPTKPTGALDSGSTDELLRLFAEINRAGQTIVMVTHSVKAASQAGRVLFIKDGQVFHQLYQGEDSDITVLSAYLRHADHAPVRR